MKKRQEKKPLTLFEWQIENKKQKKQGKKPLTLFEWQTEHKNRKSNYAFPVAVSLFIFVIAFILTRTVWFSIIIPSTIMLGTLGFALKERRDDKKAKERMSLPDSERREKYLKNAETLTFKSVESDNMRDDIINHYKSIKNAGYVMGAVLTAAASLTVWLLYRAGKSDLYLAKEFSKYFIFKLVPPILIAVGIVLICFSAKEKPQKKYDDFYNRYKDDIVRIEHSYMGGKVIVINGTTLNIGSFYLIISGQDVKAYKYDEIVVVLFTRREKHYSDGVYSYDDFKYFVQIDHGGIHNYDLLKADEHSIEMLCDEFMRHGVKIEDKRRF